MPCEGAICAPGSRGTDRQVRCVCGWQSGFVQILWHTSLANSGACTPTTNLPYPGWVLHSDVLARNNVLRLVALGMSSRLNSSRILVMPLWLTNDCFPSLAIFIARSAAISLVLAMGRAFSGPRERATPHRAWKDSLMKSRRWANS